MVVVIFLVLFVWPVSASCSGPATVAELGQSLWGEESGYDRMTRPALAARGGSEALVDNVSVQLQFFALEEVDTVIQTFTVEVYVRVRWRDERLQYIGSDSGGCFPGGSASYLGMDVAHMHNIWIPDLVFQNLAETETTLQNAWYLEPDRSVLWSRKAILTLTCTMNFAQLPFDTQNCHLLLFPWRDLPSDVSVHFYDPAVRESLGAQLGGAVEWMLHDAVAHKVEDDPAVWGCLSNCIGLSWTVSFTRRPGYYVKYILMPNVIFVLIAWCSFWVSRYAAPARTAMSIICLLVVNSQINSVMAELPKYNGDVWLLAQMSISQAFVLYAILEYAVCNLLMRIEGRVDKMRKEGRSNLDGQHCEGEEEPPRAQATIESLPGMVSKEDCWVRLCASRTCRMRAPPHVLEKTSRMLFPIFYTIASVGNAWRALS